MNGTIPVVALKLYSVKSRIFTLHVFYRVTDDYSIIDSPWPFFGTVILIKSTIFQFLVVVDDSQHLLDRFGG